MISRSVEKGTWRRKDNIEIVEITSIDGAPSTNIHHYEIVEVSMQGAKSMHVESGMYFSYQRVSPDFEFPDCELFS